MSNSIYKLKKLKLKYLKTTSNYKFKDIPDAYFRNSRKYECKSIIEMKLPFMLTLRQKVSVENFFLLRNFFIKKTTTSK